MHIYENMASAVFASANWHTKDRFLELKKQAGKLEHLEKEENNS